MDFFEAQEHARKRTKVLVAYFALAVICIILGVYAASLFILGFAQSKMESQNAEMRQYAQELPSVDQGGELVLWQPEVFAVCAVAVLLIVTFSSFGKIASLRSGGGTVARSLGGRLVDPSTRDPAERRLVNVVEEMSIASGTPVPEIYLLDNEAGINAFAAGFTTDDAAVAVTRGCLERLSRDELQGVIAHEFSHILNGDMRMNIKLMGVLFGILVIAIIGQGLMRIMFYSGAASRRSSGKGGGGALAIFLFGLAIMAIGYIGVFFGRLIQSAISRQREYLADASAVQFTRNPYGIAGALKRIGGAGSRIDSHHAQETAHMFFSSALKHDFADAFSTHPPLEERIRRVQPDWQGEYESEPAQTSFAAEEERRRAATPPPMPTETGRMKIEPAVMLAAIGTLGAGSIEYARKLRASIPESLEQAAHEPLRARALIFALLADEQPETREKQLQWLREDAGDDLADAIAAIESDAGKIEKSMRLPLLEMALPALAKKFTPGEYEAFLRRVNKVVAYDEQVTAFEFALQRLVKKHLGARFGSASPGGEIRSLGALRTPAAIILSLLSGLGAQEKNEQKKLFEKSLHRAPLFRNQIEWRDPAGILFDDLDAALDKFARAKFAIRKQLLGAGAAIVAADGEITEDEAEIMRAVSAALDCPMPPLQPHANA